jgi:putative phosphoesterase
MKIAVISDIHSNYRYLETVSDLIKKEQVSKIIFLGDAVGYYDDPNAVINWLRKNEVLCIKGNHDKYLIGELRYDISQDVYYRIVEQKKIVSAENIEFIKSWTDERELSFNNKKFFISHSGLDDCEKYCRSVLELNKEKLRSYDYYLFGHTHVPWLEYFYGTCIINPGSVGQPRDYSTCASFAVVDLNTNRVSLVKPQVEFHKYTQHLTSLGYDSKIINILSRSK